jgi:hypothetical protein
MFRRTMLPVFVGVVALNVMLCKYESGRLRRGGGLGGE